MSNGNETSLGEKVINNWAILLALGILFPGIFYFAWGLIEVFVFHGTNLSDYLQQSGIGQQLLGGK